MAAKYWVGGTANWDTTAGTKWALTSGGAGGQTIPTSADDVFIDNRNAPNWAALTSYALAVIRSPLATANGFYYEVTTAGISGAVEPTWPIIVGNTVTDGTITWTCRKATVSVSAATNCLTLIFTNYIGTFTINNGFTLTVFGTAITLATGMTYNQTTTGILSTRGNQAAITITFASIIIPNLTLGKTTAGTGQAVTISGTTPTIKNLVITNGASNAGVTLLSSAITITGSISNTLGTFSNNTGQITFSGTCTISAPGNSYISGGFIVGSGSSLQMINDVYLQNGTITFTGTGALIPGTFTLFCPGVITFNTGTVTWYNITLTATGQIYPLSSALNISNNLTVNTTGAAVGISGAFPINVSGSYLNPAGGGLGISNTLNMLGTGTIEMFGGISGTATININGTGTYTFGSVAYPTTSLTNITLVLVGVKTAQVYSTTGHTLSLNTCILSTNNTATGGSQIIWGNISLLSNVTNTLTYDTTALGNLSSVNASINTGKLYVGGNLSVTTGIGGSSTIELNGSSNTTWSAGTYQNNIVINKSGVGTKVTTATGTITWGLANRTLTINSAVDFLTNSTTVTLSGTPLTINNSYGNSFRNLNIPAGITLTLGGSTTTPITGTLALSGSATFAGTVGWTCGTLTCSLASSIIILQASVTYTTTTSVTMLGTAAGLIVMRSSAPTVTRAIWTLQNPATQSMTYVSGQGIDSNAGMTIYTFGGNITTALVPLNWYNGASQGTKAFTFVS